MILELTKGQNTPLSELPDPLGCHLALITQYSLRDATVTAPNLRNRTDVIICPDEYNTKLTSSSWSYTKARLTNWQRWTIPPNRRDSNQQEDKKDRVQKILANHRRDAKDKRKATGEGEGSNAGKKKFVDEVFDDSAGYAGERDMDLTEN
ncbi:hypothetical protein F4604DRAFT_1677944 [Suillus subluteus]|nr:hypothetical protein F4604DRAFT_1677944 [Suillus subluteus]